MVDAIASSFVERLLTLLTNEGQLLLALDVQFEKMQEEMRLMRSFLKEADKVKKKDRRDVLKTITEDLRELIYDAEDVIADCQLLILKQHKERYFRYSIQFLTSRRKITKHLMKINQGIEDIKNRMAAYLDKVPTTININVEEEERLWYPILMDEDEIVGVDDDAAKLKKWILEANEPKTVIGIVGMGGLGKTTLAKKIYNDRGVKSSFKYTIFETITQSLQLQELAKKMLLQINVDENSLKEKGVDQLLDMLKRCLEDGEYLVVLDDFWERYEGWWNNLNNALPKRNGCCVIVTTREKKVARLMGATDKHIHTPPILSRDDSWSLFLKVAFASNERRCPIPLEIVARKIVSKCKGLPLAIKAVGGMMRGKGHSINEWERILKYLKEEMKENNQGEMLMSRLKLSYEELPVYLKPCFLCFSMYPEDFIMAIHEMVRRWIGEGFVSARNGKTAFQVGEECIAELMNRCLIVGARKDEFQRKFTYCGMHDTVREMVINIAREENFTSLEESNRPVFSGYSRRVGISGNSEIDGIRSKKVKKLRTLFGLYIEKESILNIKLKLCELKWLRVLYLILSETITDVAVHGKDWLDGIGSLSHLVYLHIGNCTLENIPDSIGNLYNLQIVTIYFWPNLKKLPPTIMKLDKLIALDIYICDSLDYLPAGIGRLLKLERLSWFAPTNSTHKNASQICQLKNFSQLRHLCIELKNPELMRDGDLNVLSELQHLQELAIIFGNDSDKIIAGECKLNHPLSPLRHLEVLRIARLPGESTPVWLNPTTFPNLNFLGIKEGKLLTHMGPEFWGSEHSVWKVEVLKLHYINELEEEYSRFLAAMPYLRMLGVCHCPKLKSFPIDVSEDNVYWKVKQDDTTSAGQ